MDIWERLGIDETENISQIKAAYAAKAKECHPEEHPDEYRMLQQAYKSAVQYAKVRHAKAKQGMEESALNQTVRAVMPGVEVRAEKADMPDGRNRQERMDISDTADWDKNLDYTRVRTIVREEVRDRFFREFGYIAQNPYLINHIACWRFFLNLPDYQPLLAEIDFPRRLADAVSRFAKWDRETILYFDRWLQYGKDCTSRQRSVLSRVWIRLLLDSLLFAGKNETMVEMGAVKIHGTVLEQVRNSGIWISDRPQNADAVERYLQFYFSYAEKHELELKQIRRKNRRFRAVMRAAETVGVLALLLAGNVLLSRDSARSVDSMEDGKTETVPYSPLEEEKRRIEDIFEDTINRYQNWNEP